MSCQLKYLRVSHKVAVLICLCRQMCSTDAHQSNMLYKAGYSGPTFLTGNDPHFTGFWRDQGSFRSMYLCVIHSGLYYLLTLKIVMKASSVNHLNLIYLFFFTGKCGLGGARTGVWLSSLKPPVLQMAIHPEPGPALGSVSDKSQFFLFPSTCSWGFLSFSLNYTKEYCMVLTCSGYKRQLSRDLAMYKWIE